MADAATVSVLIQAKDQASAQFQKVEGNMGKLAAGFQKHRRAIGLAATAIGGAITGIAALSVKSSLDQQVGIRQLDQALKNVGTSYDGQKKKIEEVIAAQQRKTNFGDEEQRKALQELVLVSGSYEDAMAAMIPTMDLAAGKNMDLGAAATLVARAISGEETALGRYGIEVEKGAGSTAVLTEIMAKFGGQAEAAADPMTQLKNRTGDLFQVMGDALLPVLETLLPMIEKAMRRFIEWTEAHPNLTKALALAAVAIGGILLVVGPLLLLLPTIAAAIGILSGAFIALNLSMGPVTLVIIAVAAAIAAGILIWKNWDKIIEIVKKGVALFVKGFVEYIKMFAKAASAIAGFIPGLDGLKKKIDEGIGKLDNMADGMEEWAHTGQRSFSDVGEAASDSQREIAMAAVASQEDMGDVGRASEKMAVNFKESTEVVIASAKGWGFEIDKATGITEEMAVRTATATRNIAEAFQEAGDESMTGAQEIAAAARLAGKVVDEETTKMESDWDAWMSSMDRQEIQLKSILGDMDEEMGLMSAGTLEHLLDIEFGIKKHEKAWEELPDAVAHAVDKIPQILGDADFELQKTLDRMGDKLTDNIHSWGDELEGFTAEENRKLDEARDRAEKKRKDEEKDAAEAERQRMIEKFKGTPQFASMAEQREKLRSVQHALESQKGALPSMRQAITQAEAGMQQYAGTGFGASQRRQQYWTGTVRPLQDAYQRQTERIRATRYQIEALESQIAKNVIPLEYRGIAENVLANEWMRPMQRGGIATGGLALVGERGPEVVSLPGGARVHPSGTGPGSNQFHFHGAVYGLEDLRRVVVEAVRDHALSGGFRGVFGEA